MATRTGKTVGFSCVARGIIAFLTMLFLLPSCEKPPVDDMIRAEKSLKEARDAGAGRYAPVRFGKADEALARAVVDVSGRGYLAWRCPVPLRMVGTFDGELLVEFLRALAVNAGITLHVTLLAGRNQHHIMEAVIKAVARALGAAVAIDPRRVGVPSTKGRLK